MKLQIYGESLEDALKKIKTAKWVKKGISISIAAMMVLSLSSCSYNNTETSQTNNTEVNITMETPMYDIYDFNFDFEDDLNDIEYVKKSDYHDTIQLLDYKYGNKYNFLRAPGDYDNVREYNYKYELITIDKANSLDQNIAVVDMSTGSIEVTDDYYLNNICGEHTFVLCKYRRGNENDYIVFNHNDGYISYTKAQSLLQLNNNFIAKCKHYNKKYYLCYANGRLALNNSYDNILLDGNYLFLVNGNETQIVDISTNKAITINGQVEKCKNGYIVLKHDLSGVYKLNGLKSSLSPVLNEEYTYVDIIDFGDGSNPVFSCSYNDDNILNEKVVLKDINNQKISKSYLWSDCYSLYTIPNSNNIYSRNGCYILNKYGEEIFSDSSIETCIPLYEVPKAIYIDRVTDKQGIIDLNTFIKSPILGENIIDLSIELNDGSIRLFYIVRIEEENVNVVYDEDYNEIIRGNYGVNEVCSMLSDTLLNNKQR